MQKQRRLLRPCKLCGETHYSKRAIIDCRERQHDRNREPSIFARLKRNKRGVEVQAWGCAADNTLVYAGVHFIPELTAKWIYRLHANWARWRNWYDTRPHRINEDYPAKHSPAVAFIGAHPASDPKAVKWLKL